MGLFSMFEERKRSPVKLVFYLDVGRGSGRSAVIEMRNGIPHVLYTVVGEQKIPEDTQGADAVDRVLTSLKETLEQTARALQSNSKKDKIFAAEEVYVILAAPYYLSHTSVISHKNNKPFVVSPRIIHEILEEGGGGKIPGTHSDAQISERPMILHQKVIDMNINGYHTPNPYGKSTEELLVSVFKSQISSELNDGIMRVIKQYTAAPVYIETLSLAAYVMLRNKIDNKDNFLFITIENEVSEVSLVKDGVLLETVSFPYGKYSLARAIGQKIGTTPEEALSRVILFYEKKLHPNDVVTFLPIVEAAQGEWFSYLEKSLINLAGEMSLPEDIFVIVDAEIKDAFGGIVTNAGFASQTLVPNGFNIQTLDTAIFADSCTFGLNIRFDTLLAVSASFSGAAKEVIPRLYPQKAE